MNRDIKFRGKVEGNWWYVTPDSEEWEQFWVLVDRKTVGEYTSRKNKADKEIYEDDICRIDNETHEVYWNDDRWGLQEVEPRQGSNIQWDYDNGDYYQPNEIDWGKCEVIGNIHDGCSPQTSKPVEQVDGE